MSLRQAAGGRRCRPKTHREAIAETEAAYGSQAQRAALRTPATKQPRTHRRPDRCADPTRLAAASTRPRPHSRAPQDGLDAHHRPLLRQRVERPRGRPSGCATANARRWMRRPVLASRQRPLVALPARTRGAVPRDSPRMPGRDRCRPLGLFLELTPSHGTSTILPVLARDARSASAAAASSNR